MGRVARMKKKKNACRILVRKPENGDVLEDLVVDRSN